MTNILCSKNLSGFAEPDSLNTNISHRNLTGFTYE